MPGFVRIVRFSLRFAAIIFMKEEENGMYVMKDSEYMFVFTGPDGSGRKTVADAVAQTLGIRKVPGYATRKPRPGEVDGVDYHFISRTLYDQLEEDGEFLESIELRGNKYGIRDKDVARAFEKSGSVYLILNREGADILKEKYGDHCIRLFIYADRRTVEERQRALGLPDDVIQEHLSRYEYDMEYQSQCEHAFENYDLAHTVFDITNTLEKYLNRGLVDKD